MTATGQGKRQKTPTPRATFFWQRTTIPEAARAIGLGAVCLLATSCGPGGSKAPRCEDLPPAARPTLAPLRALPPSGGSAHFEVRVPTGEIVRLVDAAIPRVLASAKNRPIGAAGLATFRAVHEKPKLFVEGTTLGLTLPIAIDISVCKPFGSLCVGYGKCKPRYDVAIRVPLRPNEDLVLPKPKLEAKVTEGCVIAIDVTEHVTRAIEGELQKLRPALGQAPLLLGEQLERAMKNLSAPVALPSGKCAFATPRTVHLDPPRLEGGLLVLGASLGLELSGDVPCDERRDAPPLPSLSPEALQPRFVLVESIPTANLETRVLELLRGAPKASDTTAGERSADEPATSVTSVRVEVGGDSVAVLAELTGQRCGGVWLRGVPRVEGAALVLRQVVVEGASDDDPALAGLRDRLEGGVLAAVRTSEWLEAEPWKTEGWTSLPELSECGVNAAISGPRTALTAEAFGVELPGAQRALGVAIALDGRLGVEFRGTGAESSCTLVEEARRGRR